VLEDDAGIRRLNRLYLKKDSPTDVLAFRMADGKFSEMHPEILGDVIISVETARRRAKEFKNSTEKEIKLYLAHGILHLLGYSDKTTKGFKKMQQLQEEIVSRYAQT